MICCTGQSNQLKSFGDISGASLSCIATPNGFLFGDNTMKLCTVCSCNKPESEFYTIAGRNTRRGRCKICENKARDLRRKANLQADLAKTLANCAVRNGILVDPMFCESCDEYGRLQKHHNDYTKPYEVSWLCQKCHSRLHAIKRKELQNA